jgi:hypothetical protein
VTEARAESRLGGTSFGVNLAPTMQDVSWHSFDLRSGRRGPRLIPADGLGTVSRILNEATETTLDVRVWHNGKPIPDIKAATKPGVVMLVAMDATETPIWGGLCYRRVRNLGQSEAVTLNLVTLEAYLDRRYADADYTFVGSDQVSQIARDMIASTLADGVEFSIDAPYSNWKRDRTYLVDEDKTILSILNELADVENGIEFTVDLAWADGDTHMVLDRIIRIRNRVGTAYLGNFGAETDNPVAVFRMPGSVTDYQYVEDYSADNGANSVIAVSSGEGDDRPESKNHVAGGVVAGFGGSMPRFEKRFTPATSITDTGTLDDHARDELQQTWDGMTELTLEANLDTAPRLGSDWFLGDDVGVSITDPWFPERINSDGEVVPGYQANVRCIGWEIDFDARRLKPRLLEATEVEVEAL